MHIVTILKRMILLGFRRLVQRLAGIRIWVIWRDRAARWPSNPRRLGLPPGLLDRLDEHSQATGLPLDKLLPGLLRNAFRQRRQPEPGALAWERLTTRERQVARLMAEGLSDREIASQLMIGLSTVKTHAQRVLMKLGCHSRKELPELPGSVRRPD